MKRFSLKYALLPMTGLLLSCGEDIDMEKPDFTTKEYSIVGEISLENEIRKDATLTPEEDETPKYELYSEYKGADIKQVTGVSGRRLILLFAAPEWCPHSRAMSATLKEIATEEKGNIQVVEINPDKYPKLAEDFKITEIPAVFVYTEGLRLRSFIGAYEKGETMKKLH